MPRRHAPQPELDGHYRDLVGATRRADGATLKELAKSYNVGKSTISRLGGMIPLRQGRAARLTGILT